MRETAVRRNGARHVFVNHLVVHYSQFQSRGISPDRQTEEDHLHHRQGKDEQHHAMQK